MVFSQKWTLINFLYSALSIIGGLFIGFMLVDADSITLEAFGSIMLYIWSYVSYTLLTNLKRGNLCLKHSMIHKTILDVETMEEFEMENTKVTEKIDFGVQTSIVIKTVKNSEVVCKEVAIQTESRKDLTKKSMEFLNLVELAEAFN